MAFLVANILRDYGPILVHLNKPELLTRDLSDAMRAQKQALSDPGKGVIMTASEVFPIILKVKVLSTLVGNKLGVDNSLAPIEKLEEIVRVSEAKGNAQFSQGIKDTLGWTRALFADPDIQAVLKMPMTELEAPDLTVKGVTKSLMSVVGRAQDEFIRVQEFLKAAKVIKEPEAPKPATSPEAPKADASTQPAAEDKKKPEPPKPATPPAP